MSQTKDEELEENQVQEIEAQDTLDLTKDLKTQFLEKHYFFGYNNQVWTQAKKIAKFLEFKEPERMIQYHVSCENKMSFKLFPNEMKADISSGSNSVT